MEKLLKWSKQQSLCLRVVEGEDPRWCIPAVAAHQEVPVVPEEALWGAHHQEVWIPTSSWKVWAFWLNFVFQLLSLFFFQTTMIILGMEIPFSKECHPEDPLRWRGDHQFVMEEVLLLKDLPCRAQWVDVSIEENLWSLCYFKNCKPNMDASLFSRSFSAINHMSCLKYLWYLTSLFFLPVCVAAPMSRDRDSYGPTPPRRDSMMSRRDDYPSPRDDHYNSKDRYDNRIWYAWKINQNNFQWENMLNTLCLRLLNESINFSELNFFKLCCHFLSYSSRDYNSRDSRDYGPPPRDYSYREYSNSSSRDDYGSMSRGYRYDAQV